MSRPIPFPLASGRYEVGPAMRRFGQAGQGFAAESFHFVPDHRLAETLAAKLAVLRRAPQEAHLFAATAEEEEGLRAAIQSSFRLLAAEHPAMATVGDDGVTLHHLGVRLRDWHSLEEAGEGWPHLRAIAGEIRAWLAGQQGIALLGNTLALAVQEDLAIVRGPRGSDAAPSGDVLEWLHVCLPSNWAPAEKIGGSFVTVHEPVVHNERLLASAGQIVRAMIQGGPFVRYVWALHRDGEFCHNPRLHRQPAWREGATGAELIQQAYFRVERQTTHGFPELNRALFTIRYWTEPLAEVVADPWRRERLASALVSMDEAALRYKGLTGVRDELVAGLCGRD
jgi:hypothetical protein